MSRRDTFLGGGLVLLSAVGLYVLTVPWPETPDGFFHLQRVRALADALRWGVLYPRWFPDFAFGYGYPVLNFYAPLFYYPPALLHLAGWDVITATRLALALGYGVSAGGMYLFLRRWVRPYAALVGSVFYQVYPYRWYDLVVRGALPEFFAFVWLPFVLDSTLTVLRVWSGNRVPWRDRVVPVTRAGIMWALLVLTHNLTAWMAALSLGVLGSLWVLWRWKARWAAGLMGGLTVVVGVALAGFYAIPAWVEMRWVGIGQGGGEAGMLRHLVAPTQMFTFAPAYPYPAPADPTVPTPAYVGVLLLIAAALAVIRRPVSKGLLWSGGASLGYLAFSTTWTAGVWEGIAPVLAPLQFPWRWYTLLTPALAVVLALVWEESTRWLRLRWEGPLAIALIGYLVAYAWGQFPVPERTISSETITVEMMWAFDARHGQVGATWTAEFLPQWVTEQRWAIGRSATTPQKVPPVPPLTSLDLTSLKYLEWGGRYMAPRDTWLTFRVFYYPAWRVEVDGQPVRTRPVTNLGLLSAQLPAGERTWRVRWAPTPAVWWGRGVTAVAWLGVFGVWWWWRRELSPVWAVLWGGVALLLLSGATGWTAREAMLRRVEADYGPLVLEAAYVSPAVDGPWEVRLFWLIRRPPEPLTAFVHVVDAGGQLVAQHDAPLGGVYTPPDRWLPNFLLPDFHFLTPPADGEGPYRLFAGVYRPGMPLQPLRADRSDRDGRVPLGAVEVPK